MTDNLPTCIVNAKFHPMLAGVTQETATQGETVQQVIDRLGRKNGVNQWYCRTVYVEINGVPLLPAKYSTTIVKSSDKLVIQYNIPEGGEGKNPLKTILLLVVTVVALYFGQVYAAYWWGPYLAAGFAIAGAYAINALIPPEGLTDVGLGHSDTSKTDVYSITGMRNYAPNYKALPMVLGRVRYAPPYGALPYTINHGNDQYLYVDFVHGHGPLLIEDLKIGETALSAYNNVTVATNSGYATDPELNLTPNDVYPDSSFSAELVYGSYVTATTQLNTKQSIVEVVFAQGLFKIDEESGERVSTTVGIQYDVAPTGTGAWAVVAIDYIADTAAYPKRVSKIINHDTEGQYDIRLSRVTPTSDDKTYDKVTFTELKSINFRDPVTFPVPIGETQLIIQATAQLNGVIDNFNAWHTSVCLDYEYTTGLWVQRATNNPASLFRYILTSTVIARPVALSKIDLDALEEWHDFCRVNNFTYNRIHDTSEPISQIIPRICAAGRAMLVQPDGNWSVIIEQPRTLGPVQMFTPANSRKLASKKTFADELHGYRITYNNEDADNQEDEITVYTQGFSESNGHIFEALQFPGVTTSAQVIALAKYHLAVRRYRSELFTWEADWEHLACSRGDLVSVAHDCILVSQASGRIKSINELTKTIVLDQQITVIDQTNYGLRIRTTPEGTEYSEVFTQLVFAEFPDWTTDTLTYTGTLPATVRRGDIYAFGELGSETIQVIITSKRPGKDMTATITAVQYSWPEMTQYLAGEFPVLNPGVTTPVFTSNQTPPPPTISHVATGFSTSIVNPDGSVINRIVVLITIPSGYKIAVESVQAEILTGDGWVRSASTNPSDPIVFENVNPGSHEIRIRTVSALGVTSAWVYRTISQVNGTPPPDPVVSGTVTGKLFQNDLRWVLPTNYRDSYRIQIFCSAGVNDRSNTGEPVATLSGGTVWSHTGLYTGISYYYWWRIMGPASPPNIVESAPGIEDELGAILVDESGAAIVDTEGGVVTDYQNALYSEWYPLSATGGIAASPISDNAQILELLTASIGQGQLSSELNTIIEGADDGIVYEQQFSYNSWTVKIQEINGNPYMVGLGAVIYPNWTIGTPYVVGDYVWFDDTDEVYKCTVAHDATANDTPPFTLTKWELIPYGKKSAVNIIADQFSISLPDGTGTQTPFIVSGNVVGINGDLFVDGSIHSTKLASDDIYYIRLQSNNYVAGVSGYNLDSINGLVEFNNATVIVRDSTTGDYAKLESGDLGFYYNDAGIIRLYKSVTRTEPGECSNGQLVYIPGIWKKKPEVILFPKTLQTYSPALGTGSAQSLNMEAVNVRETGANTRKWAFDARATLTNLPTAFSYGMTNISINDFLNTTPGLASANNAATPVSIQNTVTTITVSGAINWGLHSTTYTGNPLRGLIYVYFVCAGVATLIYSGYTPAVYVSTQKDWYGAFNVAQTYLTSGTGVRSGYFSVSCQIQLGIVSYGVLQWQDVSVAGQPINEKYLDVTASGLSVSYIVPAGSAVAAGVMNYLAIGS